MRVPYTVSTNAQIVYHCSQIMKNSGMEVHRKLVAEDFDWDDNVTPAPLTYCACLVLCKNFVKINPLGRILQKDIDMLMDLYPADIPLKFSVPKIPYEQYWKRCYEINFPERIEVGKVYWKGKYLSACLQKYLETQNPDIFIEEEGAELAALVAPYLYDLKLYQLQMVYQPIPCIPLGDAVEDFCPWSVPKLYDHLPLEPVLKQLYNLQEIALIFGRTNLEENYEPRFFEFTENDCESLCAGLKDLKNLKIFRINRSNLDCLKTKLILEHLIKKECLEELDFTNCKIGDYGMKALGGFILLHPNLKRVRIANNRFRDAGVQGLAYALQMKPAAPIELLDISMNPMSMECATMFAAAFVRCKEKPQTLMINSCGFRGKSAVKIAGILVLNRGLKRLDMAANNLSGEAEEVLVESLERNRNVLDIDLRRTRISETTKKRVAELLQRNRDLVGVDREPSAEIPPLYLNEPEYLIWEYNPNNPDHIPGRYPPRVAEV
ncbi:T-complex-associated testis-expressed protein 1 [Phthorimaea operculella]|nr:T-complex-associated testis-expressed protein 1 [Phthorimaea operculella]